MSGYILDAIRPSARRSFVGLPAALLLATLLTPGGAPAQPGPIEVTFPWDWHLQVEPNLGDPTNPDFGEPIEIWLWGEATVEFQPPRLIDPIDPAGPSPQPTFDLGPGGVGAGLLTPEAPPENGVYEIETELVQLELRSSTPVLFPQGASEVVIRLDPNRRSTGRIGNIQNQGDGTVIADSFFDIGIELELTDLNMTLRQNEAVRVGMGFGLPSPTPPNPTLPPLPPFPDPLPELDILWAPTWIWREGFAQDLFDDAGGLWDRWVSIHGHVTPEPGSAMMALVGLGCVAARRRHR